MNPFVVQFRRWLSVEDTAFGKVLESLESVPADRRAAPEYVRAAGILAHITMARRLWLDRMTGGPPPSGPIFPDGTDLAKVAADWQAVCQGWERFLDGQSDADLARTFDYTPLAGGRFRSAVGDVLPHLFTHAAYHRGQIAMLVKQAGGTPAATDFTVFTRETVPAG